MKSFPPPKNILVIPLRYIGDTILTVPLLRNLRHYFPGASIDVLTSRTAAPLLEPCPYIRQIVREPASGLALISKMRSANYDTAFILRKSFTMALLCRLGGIGTLVGYDKQRFPQPVSYKRWGWLLDYTARYPSLKTDIPQAVSHLGLLEACGYSPIDNDLELWATQADTEKVESLLGQQLIDPAKPLAVIHTVSASHGKTLEIAKFARSARYLHEAGYQVLCTGTAEDAPHYEQLAREAGVPLANLAGKTSLRETFALYRKTRLMVTVDSSPLHLAAAAGIPEIVGVFGPTNEKQWGAHSRASAFHPVFVDLPCRPCYAKVCAHNNCRMTLTEDMILASVIKATSGANARV